MLPPDEIHRLATKTRGAVGAGEGQKASCHSDLVDPDAAQHIQSKKLVQISTKRGREDAPSA